ECRHAHEPQKDVTDRPGILPQTIYDRLLHRDALRQVSLQTKCRTRSNEGSKTRRSWFWISCLWMDGAEAGIPPRQFQYVPPGVITSSFIRTSRCFDVDSCCLTPGDFNQCVSCWLAEILF